MTIDPVSLGITAAVTAASMAATAMQEFEGPRLNDTRATVADYGTPLNYLVGTRIVTCPAFFAKPIMEKKKKRKGKAGKQTSYTGYCTWAAHIADHSISNVLKIWFDNHLVYDATGGSVKLYPLADDYELALHVRFYYGTEDQEPDPDMLAYVEARDGPGTCSAYRGTAYAYFENVPTEQLGNRFPDVKMLVGGGLVGSSVYFLLDTSGSMDGVRLATLKTAMSSALDLVEAAVTVGRRVDIGVRWWSATTGAIERVDADLADVADIRAFVAGLTVSGGTDFNAGMPAAVSWFTGSLAFDDIGRRSLIFITDGEPSPPESAAAAAATASTMLDQASDPFSTASGTAVNMFGINIELSDTSFTEMLDNTPADDVPVVDGGDPSGLIDAVRTALGGAVLTSATLEDLLTIVSRRAGLDPSEYDWSQATQLLDGYNWTQGSGQQVIDAVLDLFDVDLRPHDFVIEALPRGGASQGAIVSDHFAAAEEPFAITGMGDTDLPRRIFLGYADSTADQQPNVASPSGRDAGATGSEAEVSIDFSTLALTPDTAQQLVERKLRRRWFGHIGAEFGLTRQYLGIEPGDVWSPDFDGVSMTMCCRKLVLGADGRLAGTWERDHPAVAALSGSAGAPASGHVPDTVPDGVDSLGEVLDLPLLVDAHDQTAPLAYLVAGPEEPGVWMGADFATSDTGELDSYVEGWDGIAAGDGAVIGTCAGALAEALPWVLDAGSTVTVEINAGELTAATLDELLLDETRNLAAIRSTVDGIEGWELVQFLTPTLTAERTYAITGFLRGVRGSEWAIGGHEAGDTFVLLDATAKIRTLGASEIADTDWYVVSSTGQAVDQDEAFDLAYTAASHKPYAAVDGAAELDGADWLIDATRRTRIGAANLDGGDVPLGEVSEAWQADVLDGPDVVRVLTGTSLPLTYTEAQQIEDFGSAQSSIAVRLYQMSPALNLRGYPLAIAA